jgi:hypothetical protein
MSLQYIFSNLLHFVFDSVHDFNSRNSQRNEDMPHETCTTTPIVVVASALFTAHVDCLSALRKGEEIGAARESSVS